MSEIVEPEKRVDPRIKRTRQWLQQALLDLLKKRSFESITVQELAERAGVNRVTFYAHFPDKFALLEYAVSAWFQQELHVRIPEDAPFTAENLAIFIESVAEILVVIQNHCPSPREKMNALLEKQVIGAMYNVVLGWLTPSPHSSPAHLSPSQPTIEQTAMMTSWAICGAVLQWSQKEPRQPAKKLAQQILPLVLAGLRLHHLPT